MNIDWAALGQVFGVSLVMTVGLVGAFTLGIVGTSSSRDGGSASAGARMGAYVAFAVCAAAVGYGIYLIVA
ncbi:hypothetical protein ACSNOK_32775 [Streptomyces sp. URMC 126]|uniref:hypothetical protein n=1 Tax=Streptomyces sp. URMC 126 TaxID=3423401 RepID=UPI003F1AD962